MTSSTSTSIRSLALALLGFASAACVTVVEERGVVDDDVAPGGASGASAVTLYQDADFQGAHTMLSADDPDLGDDLVGNDRVSSVRVPAGCTVTLYHDTGFRGRSIELDRDAVALEGTTLGNDVASSARVRCRSWAAEPAGSGVVTLYEDDRYRGQQERFAGDDPDLTDDPIGNDRVSSVEVGRGCRVTLYADVGYRGASTTLEDDIPDLDGTRVGNDTASSLRVSCRR